MAHGTAARPTARGLRALGLRLGGAMTAEDLTASGRRWAVALVLALAGVLWWGLPG